MRVYPLPVLSFTFPVMRKYYCLSMLVAFRRQIQPFRLFNPCCSNVAVIASYASTLVFAPDMSTVILPPAPPPLGAPVPPPAALRPLSKIPIVSNSRVKRSPGGVRVQLIVRVAHDCAVFVLKR